MKIILMSLALVAHSPLAKADSCNFPDDLKPQLKAAIDYKKDSACSRVLHSFNKTGGSKKGEKIVISDYRKSPAMMYIFDSDGESCLKALPVDYGTGAGKDSEPKASCNSESHQTPAGFHVTDETHDSAKYPQPNSLGLVGLEGQNSLGRGILLHGATGDGGAHTWGCSGVAKDQFAEIRDILGGGSLIYNYFGEQTNSAADCGKLGKNQCSPDSGAGKGAGGSSGSGGGGGSSPKTSK